MIEEHIVRLHEMILLTNKTQHNMKKILMAIAAVALLVGCTKETINENENENENGAAEYDTVNFYFSPYQMSPMKGGEKTTTSVATVCSRLDIYIIDIAEGDTMRWHQERTATTGFGTLTATLKTNKSYHLYAVAHNTTDTATFSGGVFSFADNLIKQCMVADTVFSPGDGLSLSVTMRRIVGMFKMRVTDEIPGDVTGFQFTVSSSGRKWNLPTMTSADPGVRLVAINSTSTDNNGVAVYNVYIMADNMTAVKYVDVTAKAITVGGDGEEREFSQVPIQNGYVTTYSGTFFITFDMGFTFLVGEWGDGGNYDF